MPRIRRSCLSGCVISVTDGLENPKTYYSKLIRENGGRFSLSIIRATTHLIASEEEVNNEDSKVTQAISKGIFIVSEKWLQDSLQSNSCKSESKYSLVNKEQKIKNSNEEEEEEIKEIVSQEELDRKAQKLKRFFLKNFEHLLDDEASADIVFLVKDDSTKRTESMEEMGEEEDKMEEEAKKSSPRKKSTPKAKTETKKLEKESVNKIYAHKAIIFSGSLILKELIEKSTNRLEGKILVEINDSPYNLFQALIQTIYTSEVPESQNSPGMNLAFIDICQKYGLEDVAFWLQTSCWHPKNICLLLEMALAKRRSNSKQNITLSSSSLFPANNQFDTLFQFFCQHASSALKSESFKLLSENSLKEILDSNELEINELDLFQAVVSWIDNTVSLQPEAQKSAKRQQLVADLISKIRFPLMSSSDLILHVEPLKLVPKELLLEAYRHLAVDLSPKFWSSIRCKPRGLSKPRWMKEIWFHQINRWIQDTTKQKITIGKVLYTTERDEKSNAKFHEKCNNQSPTITVVKSGQYVFGGFTLHPWGSTNQYTSEKFAFIFSLTNGHSRKPQKFIPVTNKQWAVYDSPSSGPTWGGGHDLHIDFDGQSYSSLGHTYQVPKGLTYGDNSSALYLAGSKTFPVDSCYVFQGKKHEKTLN